MRSNALQSTPGYRCEIWLDGPRISEMIDWRDFQTREEADEYAFANYCDFGNGDQHVGRVYPVSHGSFVGCC